MKQSIMYKDGYKYQLYVDYVHPQALDCKPVYQVSTPYLEMTSGGILTIKKGYAWDGPSGPTWDTKNFMTPSLVHDALYQLMRMGYLYANLGHRKIADLELYRMCRERGMWYVRAQWVYAGVRLGGRRAASQAGQKEIIIAP